MSNATAEAQRRDDVISLPQGLVVWAPDHSIYGPSRSAIISNLKFSRVKVISSDFTLKKLDSYKEEAVDKSNFLNPLLQLNIRYLDASNAGVAERLILTQPDLSDKVSLFESQIALASPAYQNTAYRLGVPYTKDHFGTYALFFPLQPFIAFDRQALLSLIPQF